MAPHVHLPLRQGVLQMQALISLQAGRRRRRAGRGPPHIWSTEKLVVSHEIHDQSGWQGSVPGSQSVSTASPLEKLACTHKEGSGSEGSGSAARTA